jgi:hypothetical protein
VFSPEDYPDDLMFRSPFDLWREPTHVPRVWVPEQHLNWPKKTYTLSEAPEVKKHDPKCPHCGAPTTTVFLVCNTCGCNKSEREPRPCTWNQLIDRNKARPGAIRLLVAPAPRGTQQDEWEGASRLPVDMPPSPVFGAFLFVRDILKGGNAPLEVITLQEAADAFQQEWKRLTSAPSKAAKRAKTNPR